MKTIIQSEAAECGLACLAMVADKYSYKTNLNILRQKYPQTLKGTDLQQLIYIADELKLTSRALKLSSSELIKLQLPCILHWDMNHFVVLKSSSKKSITILDPAVGKRTLSIKEVEKHFTGVALELRPAFDFKKKNEKVQLKLSHFLGVINGVKPVIVQLLLLSFILQIFALASPYYMRLVVDEVIVSYDKNLLSFIAMGFAALTLFNVATSALRSFIVIHLGTTLNQQLAFNLFRHLLRLPLDYFSKRHIGDVVSRFSSLKKLKEMVTTIMIEAVIDGVMAIATLIMLYIYSTKLTVVVCLAMFFYFIIRLLWYAPFRAISEETIIANAKESSNFMENIRGIQTIKLFNIESKRQAMWQNYYIEALNSDVRVARLELAYNIINNIIFGFENILVIYLGAQMIINSTESNIFTIGMMIAFIAYKGQFTNRFASLIDKLIEFKMLSLHLERLADIALTEEEKNLESELSHEVQGKIEVINLGFRHSKSEPWLFRNLNFCIEQGSSVAIVGSSGCGKTTLMKLMVGLIEPEEGEILIDGVDVNKIGKKKYRQQIATVMQNDELLSGSIADNISQFDPKIDIEKVKKCSEMASIADDISKMPMKYNSLIGDMGAVLSGGQKQRLLLARAFYREPKILYFDEATSNLDAQTEKNICMNISKLNITRISIAHREETIKTCDRILDNWNKR